MFTDVTCLTTRAPSTDILKRKVSTEVERARHCAIANKPTITATKSNPIVIPYFINKSRSDFAINCGGVVFALKTIDKYFQT